MTNCIKYLFTHKMLVLMFLSFCLCAALGFIYSDLSMPKHVLEKAKNRLPFLYWKTDQLPAYETEISDIPALENEVVSEKIFYEMLVKNCNMPFHHVRVVTNSSTLSLSDYKNYLSDKFIRETANPFPKKETPPKLDDFKVIFCNLLK